MSDDESAHDIVVSQEPRPGVFGRGHDGGLSARSREPVSVPWLVVAGVQGVDAWVAALPGRGARLDELPITSFEPLVEALLAELAPTLPRRYALFGHSLGAYLAFEVARRLPANRWPSSSAGPHRRSNDGVQTVREPT